MRRCSNNCRRNPEGFEGHDGDVREESVTHRKVRNAGV